MKTNLMQVNPPSRHLILTTARLSAAASAILCLGLVRTAYPQSDIAQTAVTHDAVGQSNEMLPPLVDLGPGQTYKEKEGGLYPGGSNVRPAAHDAAGRKIAREIVPLDASGKPDPVNGKIVFTLVSVSNAYGAWHRGDEEDTSTTFITRANSNPAKNPKLFIAYGFEYQLPGGNGGTGDPGLDSIFYRTLDHALRQQGLTPKQVQIVWLSMPVSGRSWGINLTPEEMHFPADAQQSKLAWKEIVHAIYVRYPNVKIIYSSTKGAMYMTVHDDIGWGDWNGGPIEPWNHDAAWGVKWVIEDQINGAPDLNYDPARGPVKAPWLSWGPYYWSHPDGTPRDYDGFVWTRADVAEDGLHPSLSGLTKYANLLLHQMTTDPTATPWFLQPDAPANQPPSVAKTASVAANPVSGTTTVLSVLGADDGGEANLTYTWSCSEPEDVTFSTNGPNKAKNTMVTFQRPGRYSFQVMIADAGGLTATSSIGITVAQPGGRTLLKATQLRRVGGWRVDPYVRNGKSMAYSEGGIDMYDGHFWLSHHAHLDAVARFEIPQSIGTGDDVNAWPVLKATDYIESKWRVQGGAATMGVHQLNAQLLLVSARSYYATPPTSEPWLQRFDLGSRQWLTPLKPKEAQIQHNAGGFCRIPKWFAEENLEGRTLGLCAGGYESGQGSSMGPALTAVDCETLTDGVALLSYPWAGEKAQREQRPADYDPKGLGWALEPDGEVGYWSAETQQGGGAWIDTGKYHGLVYFIRQGRGHLDYKLQTECFSKYRLSRLYIYDPADLAKVAAGELEPFEPRAVITDWHEPGVARGATWDGRHLFVFQEGTWGTGVERYPSIHVFEIVDVAE